MLVNGVEVKVNGLNDISEKEILNYINYVKQNSSEALSSLTISDAGNGEVSLDYQTQPAQFERIRRITGYLVGTIDRFNNAKRAEEHDRVKHGLN